MIFPTNGNNVNPQKDNETKTTLHDSVTVAVRFVISETNTTLSLKPNHLKPFLLITHC